MSRNSGPTFAVSGVCCSTEEAVLRKALDRSLGQGRYHYNMASGELRVEDGIVGDTVMRSLRGAGFGGKLTGEQAEPEEAFLRRHGEAVVAVLAGLLTLAGIAAAGTLSRVFLGGAIVLGGWRIVRRAVGTLRTRTLDMHVLMCVAVAGALAIGRWEEGAAVIVLFAVSLMLEGYSSTRTRRALRSLMSLSPDTARVVRDGVESTVPSAEVPAGSIIVIRPGERVPIDGMVVEGCSSVDEAPLTGESSPAEKGVGDTVYAGSLNGTGVLRLGTTRMAGESAMARIAALVDEAQERRAPVQLSVDRFARRYTPAVLAVAVLVAVVPPLFTGAAFGDWLYRALVLLVIACPCALVIATPVALVSALTHAARSGVLIKGGKHVETLARVTVLALDKTGTLTTGTPVVTDVVPLDSQSRGEVLAIVAALEANSEHHLASAVRRASEAEHSHHPVPAVRDFQALPGRGLRGTIGASGYVLGNRALIRGEGMLTPGAEEVLTRLDGEGKTSVILASGGNLLGIVAFRDGVRHHGKGILQKIRAEGIRRVVMLSGDHGAAAGAIAAGLGIDDVRAGLLPAQKVEEIERLKRTGGIVGMVGDGINDTPALAAASVGIAMGVSGSDAALESADVVLMSDNLGHLPYLFGLSRTTLRIIRQNIALAVTVKLAVFILALTGHATLWMAILADDGAALAVILNALRVMGYRTSR